MTPIPADVAAAIGAAGYGIQATALSAWLWSRGELRETPAWLVCVGNGRGRGTTARAATIAALSQMASEYDSRATAHRAEAKRVRAEWKKQSETESADAAAKRAADARALAERVAAMWPEVTP